MYGGTYDDYASESFQADSDAVTEDLEGGDLSVISLSDLAQLHGASPLDPTSSSSDARHHAGWRRGGARLSIGIRNEEISEEDTQNSAFNSSIVAEDETPIGISSLSSVSIVEEAASYSASACDSYADDDNETDHSSDSECQRSSLPTTQASVASPAAPDTVSSPSRRTANARHTTVNATASAAVERARYELRHSGRVERSWNERYIAVAQQFSVGDVELSMEAEVRRTAQLEQLCAEFAEEARRWAKVIVHEFHMPVEQRTIPPVTKVLGGIAGGEKFIKGSILYKFALDHEGIYGGHEYAMKTAAAELRGVMALQECRVADLYLPLMALVHYRGVVVVAQSLLPISAHTLRYGSADGGKTIHDDDPALSQVMAICAQRLNLQPHLVYPGRGSRVSSSTHSDPHSPLRDSPVQPCCMHGPTDLEGHRGEDGRLYLIDTARLFPPAALSRSSPPASHLYKLLRPELVRNYPEPLCSDAYSRMGSHPKNKQARQQQNRNVLEATRLLEDELIVRFCQYLVERYPNSENGDADHLATEDENPTLACHSSSSYWSSSSSFFFFLYFYIFDGLLCCDLDHPP